MPTLESATSVLHDHADIARIGKLANSGTASLTDLKTQWDKIVKRTRRKPVEIMRKGEPAAVLVSVAHYRCIAKLAEAFIEELEDAEDVAAVAERKREKSIPFEDVVASLKRRGKL